MCIYQMQVVQQTRSWNSLERFCLYGLCGFASEVCFTALWEMVEHGNRKLIGVTSMYVFIVYGISIFVLEHLYRQWKNLMPQAIRVGLYVIVCYFWEFTLGYILKRYNACPWDYESYFHYHFMGLITFEYVPVWYVACFLCEKYVIQCALTAAWIINLDEIQDGETKRRSREEKDN